MSNLKEYYVSVTIHNTFLVTAEDEDHAEEIVQGMYAHNLLDNSELNVNYVDEVPSV
jgi:hypothetical protein